MHLVMALPQSPLLAWLELAIQSLFIATPCTASLAFLALPSMQGLINKSRCRKKVGHAARGQMSGLHDSMLTAIAKTAQVMVPSQPRLLVESWW